MTYEKTNWQTGDIITAEKLNKLENGVSNGGGIELVTATKEDDLITLNASWNDVYNAITSGKIVAYIKNDISSQGQMEMATIALVYCSYLMRASAETTEDTDTYIACFSATLSGGSITAMFFATDPDAPLEMDDSK